MRRKAWQTNASSFGLIYIGHQEKNNWECANTWQRNKWTITPVGIKHGGILWIKSGRRRQGPSTDLRTKGAKERRESIIAHNNKWNGSCAMRTILLWAVKRRLQEKSVWVRGRREDEFAKHCGHDDTNSTMHYPPSLKEVWYYSEHLKKAVHKKGWAWRV